MTRTKFDAHQVFTPSKGKRGRGHTELEPAMNLVLEDIWNAIAAIPRGQVSTYGDVARMAGLPGRARQAAYALAHIPADMELPWQRVVGAGGKIVFPKGSQRYREQARRLKNDGVPVKDGKVPRDLVMNVDRF